jgi:hypothetical protein
MVQPRDNAIAWLRAEHRAPGVESLHLKQHGFFKQMAKAAAEHRPAGLITINTARSL